MTNRDYVNEYYRTIANLNDELEKRARKEIMEFDKEIDIRADFLRIMSNIMESSDAEEIWDNYKEQIIDDIEECSDWPYNDSDVRIAISHLLRDKLLNE